MKHAKTPWYYEQDGGAPYLVGNDGYDRVVEGVGKPITANANLRHIAKCVNAHDALVAALESTTRQLEDANDEAWRRTNDAAWDMVTKRRGI